MSENFEKEPWEFERDDFELTDLYYNVSRPYRIWHEYLRLSPTFSLAVKMYDYNQKLSTDELRHIPEDFADIVKTYKRMAAVKFPHQKSSDVITDNEEIALIFQHPQGTFRSWWLRHGADVFGCRNTPPPASIITVPYQASVDMDKFIPIFNNYLEVQRLDDGTPGFNLLAIPLSSNKKELLASISKLFDDNYFKPIAKQGESIYQLKKGKHLAKLPNGLRLIWMAAMEPKLEKWRLGIKAKVTKYKRYNALDPSLTRHTPETTILSETLDGWTINRLNEAVIIMENAARGRFPCDDPTLLPKINQPEMIRLVGESINRRLQNENYRKEFHDWRAVHFKNI